MLGVYLSCTTSSILHMLPITKYGKLMNKLEFIHCDEKSDRTGLHQEYIKVMYRNERVLVIERQRDLPFRWVAIDNAGKQCFEPNQYRNDLIEQITYEGEFDILDHESYAHDFTEGLTPVEMLKRLKEFAVYGLDGQCREVEQLVAKLEGKLNDV